MLSASYPSVSLNSLEDSYDYIIIGGGAAGCVLANRLSLDSNLKVLLVERGVVNDTWLSRIPLLSSHFASDGSLSRVWKSKPQARLYNRVYALAGGNALGGSSRVNAMLYVRGVPAEFNRWAQGGRRGWGYDDLHTYFVTQEASLDPDVISTSKCGYHGVSGEWQNRSHAKFHWSHTAQVIKASQSLGLPYHEDINATSQSPHGCGKLHYNIDARGSRHSTFRAFLPEALVRSRHAHLHICTQAVAAKIELGESEDDEGLTATGVRIISAHGSSRPRTIQATRQVILSSGSFSTPQLLMLSGIGPQGHLQDLGIVVHKDLPGVGSHLQDHLAIPAEFKVPVLDSLVKLRIYPWIFIKEFLLYVLFGVGLLLAPVLELAIFIQSRLLNDSFETVPNTPSDEDPTVPKNLPDIEVMPISWGEIPFPLSLLYGGLTFFCVLLRPNSLGTVRLASGNPRDDPIIDMKYLHDPQDLATMRTSLKFVRRLKERMANQGYSIQDHEMPKSENDDDLDDFIRRRSWTTNHYTSTCRMAPESENGVVDDRLRVYGVRHLRIADASIFPSILSTHTAAATVAVAGKCADMISEDDNQG